MSHSVFLLLLLAGPTNAFHSPSFVSRQSSRPTTRIYSDKWREGDDSDSNVWISSEENTMDSTGWEASLESKKDGSLWSTFESSDDDQQILSDSEQKVSDEVAQDAWLDQLAQLSSEEVEFNMKEADRADKARRMEEWGFDSVSISNTLDVATDTSLEDLDQVAGMTNYRNTLYETEVLEDPELVESHTKVDIDEETGEPVRTQMVYVDEHACIGCTNCAMIAGNTFFMQQDYGRARVFSQWGDDDETIQIAIETCPVDCIHYIPYDELARLEVDRRGQTINFKSRLVGSSDMSHMVGGAVKFSSQQKISGNQMSRCNNCPSRGCKNCPMYGVGKNPEFELREQKRKDRIAKKKMQQEREKNNKSADL
jgi:ferredoxin